MEKCQNLAYLCKHMSGSGNDTHGAFDESEVEHVFVAIGVPFIVLYANTLAGKMLNVPQTQMDCRDTNLYGRGAAVVRRQGIAQTR